MLAVVLKKLNMSQSDFAARTGLSAKHVNQILNGVASLSADSAVVIERVCGMPATELLELDVRWQENRSRHRQTVELGRYAEWANSFPLRELVAREYITEPATPQDAVTAVLTVFRVADREAFDRVWLAPMPGGFKRAQQWSVDQFATVTWLLIAERQVEANDLASFNVTALRRAIPRLRRATKLTIGDGFREARRILAACGVGLTFVPEISGSRIRGATWWPALNRPIVALSERHKMLDSFWYALFHEIAHLLLHPRREVFLEFDGDDNRDGQERQADDHAAATLIPAEYDSAIVSCPKSELQEIADTLEVGVSLVAGRRAFKAGAYREMSSMRGKLDVAALTAAESEPIGIRA